MLAAKAAVLPSSRERPPLPSRERAESGGLFDAVHFQKAGFARGPVGAPGGARAHVDGTASGPAGWGPLGSANTRAGLWRPARPRGAAPKSGLPRFPPKRRARVAGGTCTDQPRAAGGTRRLARSWGTYRPANTPKGGPGPCPLATFYICETKLCQLVKTLL